MMKFLSLPIAFCAFSLLFACKVEPAQPKIELKYETRQFVKRDCVNDQQCAEYNVFYLLFSGNDTAVVRSVSQGVHTSLVTGLGGNLNLPLEVALDSVGINFIEQFIQLKRDFPEQTMNQSIQVTSNVLLNNGRVLTVREDFYLSTGGAHPNTSSAIMSFSLNEKGRQLSASDLLKDPTAVLPMLEKAFKKSKGLAESADISLLLLTEDKKLPLPANIGIVPEGILFVYTDYEVAAHAIGPTEILLTWTQLGDLADKSKWVE
jgi:hypothetical protein